MTRLMKKLCKKEKDGYSHINSIEVAVLCPKQKIKRNTVRRAPEWGIADSGVHAEGEIFIHIYSLASLTSLT